MRRLLAVAILSFAVLLLGVLANNPRADEDATSATQKWEYRDIYNPSDEALKDAARRAGKAFAVAQHPTGAQPIYYFKRLKQ